MRPERGTYPAYYENYIPLVKQENVVVALEQNWNELKELLLSIPKDKEDYAYAEGKWNVKQVFIHLSDAERIFAYRALRFARKDPQLLPSFEENDYAAAADGKDRTLQDVMEEFESVRKASITLFKSFSTEALLRSGNTFSGPNTVIAIGFTICGHAIHHMNVLRERYGL